MSSKPDFGTFGRFKERPLEEMPADQRAAYDLDMKLRSDVPGPQKIWICNPELNAHLAPLGDYIQGRSTLTVAEVEIVTNLTAGHWRATYATHVHEKAAVVRGHLQSEVVEALITGFPTEFDDPRQQVVYEVASALLVPRVLPLGLHRRAVSLLGDAGLVDLTAMIGYFTTLSLTLRAYDVPSHAAGLKR